VSFPFPWQFGLPENNTEIEFDADNDKNMDVKDNISDTKIQFWYQ